jgi:hypothetical protein
MDRIIGKWWYALLLVSSWMYAGMNLRVVDTRGALLEQVATGQPFNVEVIVTDISVFNKYPVVAGLDQFTVKNSGMRITTINGQTTAQYMYEVRIDTPGTYVLGPAQLEVRGNTFASNKVTIRVADETIIRPTSTSNSAKTSAKQEPAFVRFTTDKQQVVEGERIGCRLRFYFTDSRLSLKQLIMQDNKQISRTAMRGPFTGTEVINGTTYNYAEWDWDSYIKQAGRHVLPAYGIDYERESEDRSSAWGGFSRFFGRQIEQKRIYSNAVSMQVDPLPNKKGIQGIGSFSYLEISAQPSVAKQGEGIIINLELAGDGNMHEVTIPQLVGVPKELRCYESKQSIEEPEEKGDLYKKRFEFVVQGLKTGSWELPAQAFTYYDVNDRTTRTLKTAPLTITIMPGIVKASAQSDDSNSSADKKMIAPLDEKGSAQANSSGWQLSWGMIWFLALLPIALLVLRGMMIHFRRRVKVPYELIREKYAFSHARKQFEKLRAQRDARRLYALFVELIANKCKTSLAGVTTPFIAMQLKQKGLADDTIEQWNLFFKTITERAYGSHEAQQDEELFKQAERWLNELQKIL